MSQQPVQRHARLLGLLLGACSLLLFAPWGCKKDDKPAEGGGAASAEQGGKVAEPAPEPPILRDLAVLSRIPKDAVAVAAADGIRQMAARLGRERLVEKYREPYEEAARSVKALAGVDVLDPANLKSVGVDPDGPIGIVFLDSSTQTGMGFARLTDAAVLEKTVMSVAAMAKMDVERVQVGAGVVLRAKGDREMALLLLDGWLFLIGTDHHVRDTGTGSPGQDTHGRDNLGWATAIAELKAADSLAAHEPFGAAMAGLRSGKAAAGYLSMGRLVQGVVAGARRRQARAKEEMKAELDRSLARLKAAGLSDTMVKEAEERLRQSQAEQDARRAEWMAREEVELGMMEMLFSDITIAAGVRVGQQELTAEVRFGFGDRSPLAKLLVPASEVPLIVRATPDVPFHLMSARYDVRALVDLVQTMTKRAGQDTSGLDSMLRERLQVSLGELGKLFDGQAGFALVGVVPLSSDIDEEKLLQAIDGHIVLGLGDAGKVETLLALASMIPPVKDFVAKEGDAYVVTVPKFKKVHVAVMGKTLVATTDARFLQSIAGGSLSSFAGKLKNPALAELLGRPDASAAFMMNFVTAGYLFLAGKMDQEWPSVPEPTGGDEAAVVQWQELQRLRKDVDAREEAHRKAEEAALRTVLDALGHLATEVSVSDGAWVLRGGLYFGSQSLPALCEVLVEQAVLAEKRSRERQQIWKSRERIWELQGQLRSGGWRAAPAVGSEPVAPAVEPAVQAPAPPVQPDAVAPPVAPRVRDGGPADERGAGRPPNKGAGGGFESPPELIPTPSP